MSGTPRQPTPPPPPEASAQQAFVNLLVAAGRIRQRLNDICASFGITHDQYNVLRILRGVHPEGHPRFEIADRLIERAPDVTRLLDRLEREELIERYRSREDRRLSLARITPKGLDLLERMDEPVRDVRRTCLDPLSSTDVDDLARICSAITASAP